MTEDTPVSTPASPVAPAPVSAKRIRVGIDVGGTFTDFVAVVDDPAAAPATSTAALAAGPDVPASQRIQVKEPSTPDDPSLAVIRGLTRLLEQLDARPADIVSIVHGTTIGLNAVIQRKGARVGLVVSSGHRDILELGRRLPKEYDLRQPRLHPLVPRNNVFEIEARQDAAGRITAEPTDEELVRVAQAIRARDLSAVAIVVLGSYRAPEFEARIAERLAELLPDTPISTSAGVWPEIREYNRASATALNMYITPLMRGYLDELQRRLARLGTTAPLYITANNGGAIGVSTARSRPVDTVLSGPASGVAASLHLAADNGIAQMVSFDMGGTSSDIAVGVGGAAEVTTRSEVGGVPLILPVIAVSAIGAGGGSIAGVDASGGLHVGPESAGAVPGPAAYGLGNREPTITDAYLASGILAADKPLGGRQTLDPELSRAALERLAPALGHTGPRAAEAAAADVVAVASADMAAGLQKVLARGGYEAAEFTLVPYGGAGPTHAALLAEEVGIGTVIVPLTAGTYCALGAVESELRRDYLRGIAAPLTEESVRRADDLLAELDAEGLRWVASESSSAAERARVLLRLEMRYAGQAFSLELPVTASELPLDVAALTEEFHRLHEQEFGHRDLHAPIHIIAAKATATGGAPERSHPEPARAAAPAVRPTRRIVLGGVAHEASVLTAADLGAGLHVTGPAVFDLPNTTVLVPPGWRAGLGLGSTLRLDREER